MHIITIIVSLIRSINTIYIYIYLFNKGLLEKCYKEENLAVTGLLLFPVWKADCKTICPMSRICPVTARLTPHWLISSQHFVLLQICVKIFHPRCCLVATVIHMQSVRSQNMHVYTHTHHTNTHTHSHSHTTHTLTLTLSHTHTHTYHTHTHSHSHTPHTLTHTHSHSHTHTLTHTH
jgi:hypothetical protein